MVFLQAFQAAFEAFQVVADHLWVEEAPLDRASASPFLAVVG